MLSSIVNISAPFLLSLKEEFGIVVFSINSKASLSDIPLAGTNSTSGKTSEILIYD